MVFGGDDDDEPMYIAIRVMATPTDAPDDGNNTAHLYKAASTP